MHRNLLTLVVLLIGTTIFVSCGGSDKHAISVPKDAAMVFHINAPSLTSKLSWDEIKATNWFKQLHSKAGEEDSTAQKLLENPESSGINTQADLVFFMKRHGKGGFVAFEGTLKDAAAFEAFNKKVSKNSTSTKDGDINIIKEDEAIITWTSSRFIYLGNAPFLAAQNRYLDPSSQGGAEDPANFPADTLVKYAKELYNLDGDNSLFSDKRFANLIKETGDMHFWFSAEHMYKGGLGSALSMLNIGTLTEGAITAASINFDNGKIAATTKSYYNKELGKLYEKYKMKNFDAAILNRIPSQNIVGLFSMNYPPEGLKEFMKVLGLDGMINSTLGELDYSMDEFVKANKGEVLIAVTDFEMKQQTFQLPPGVEMPEGYTPMTRNTPDFKVLFAASINDKAAFDKLVASAKAKLGEAAQGNLPPISYSLNDNWFAASNDQEHVNKFLAGGNNNWPIASKLGGHPVIFYVDLQKCMKPFATDTSATMANVALAESLKMWQDVVGTGGEVTNGHMQASFEINLVDKTTNSLKQLNQYIDKISMSTNRGAF